LQTKLSFLKTSSAPEILAFQTTADYRLLHENDRHDPRRLRPQDRPELRDVTAGKHRSPPTSGGPETGKTNGGRVANIARARELLGVVAAQTDPADTEDREVTALSQPCPCCGGRMIIVEIFERSAQPRAPPTASSRVDAS
jgi:hypothetical protein